MSAALSGQYRDREIYARFSRARALIALRRFDEAAAELDHATGLRLKGNGLDSSQETTRIQIVRGELFLAEQRYPEAERMFQTVVSDIRSNSKILGFLLASALLDSAKVALAQGQFAEASRLAQEALTEDLRKARNPAASADVGEASLVLAKARKALDDAPAARAAAHQAAVSLSASLGPDHALTRDALALE